MARKDVALTPQAILGSRHPCLISGWRCRPSSSGPVRAPSRLTEAVEVGRAAVSATTTSSTTYLLHRSNLAAAMMRLFERTGGSTPAA